MQSPLRILKHSWPYTMSPTSGPLHSSVLTVSQVWPLSSTPSLSLRPSVSWHNVPLLQSPSVQLKGLSISLLQCHPLNTHSWRQGSGFLLYLCVTNTVRQKTQRNLQLAGQQRAPESRVCPLTGRYAHIHFPKFDCGGNKKKSKEKKWRKKKKKRKDKRKRKKRADFWRTLTDFAGLYNDFLVNN